MSKTLDALGDRMKMYEGGFQIKKLMPNLPIVCRIDGRGFSKFTKGMQRPYDERMSNAMIETTKYLVDHTNATVGYTQSDEITLVWYSDSYTSKLWFDGRVQKMVSQLAAQATLKFYQIIQDTMPEYAKRNPTFDARVWNVPSLQEAINALLWREQDATKNSYQMAGRCYFSHKELHLKNGKDIQEMLFTQKGINWNDYPSFFKRGTYVKREYFASQRKLTEEEIQLLPPKHNARKNGGIIERDTSVITAIEIPPIMQIENPIKYFFNVGE